MIMLLGVEPDLKISAKHVQEFLAFVRVGCTAAAPGLDAEKMRLHRRVPPGKQLHAHAWRGLQDFSLVWALEGAEKTDGDPGGASHLSERQAAAGPQAAETLSGKERALRGSRDDSLALEHVNDGGGIEAAGAAQENRALQQAHIGFVKKAVAAPRALRRDEAQGFPGAQSGGRNAHAARHFADAQRARRLAYRQCVG